MKENFRRFGLKSSNWTLPDEIYGLYIHLQQKVLANAFHPRGNRARPAGWAITRGWQKKKEEYRGEEKAKTGASILSASFPPIKLIKSLNPLHRTRRVSPPR